MKLRFVNSKRTSSIVSAIGAAILSMGYAHAKRVSTEAKAPYADTVFVSASATPENVAVKGFFEVAVKVNLPNTPCSVATPCANVPVSIGAELDDATGVGALTGSKYDVGGISETQGTFTMPGGVAMLTKIKLRNGNAAKGSTMVKVFVIVDAAGKVTEVSVPPSGLVSWWRAERDAKDAQGINPGTLQGLVSFVPGKSGQAFSFASGAYVDVAPSASLQPAKVTTSAWVKNAGRPSDFRYVLAQGAQACKTPSYGLTNSTGMNLAFFIYDGLAVFPVSSPDAPVSIWDGNWHFVVGTYDGAMVRLYVDGIEQGSGTPSTITIKYDLPDSQDFNIGGYPLHSATCSLDATGPIDEVRIFNRAITPDEVKALYQGAKIEVEQED